MKKKASGTKVLRKKLEIFIQIFYFQSKIPKQVVPKIISYYITLI